MCASPPDALASPFSQLDHLAKRVNANRFTFVFGLSQIAHGGFFEGLGKENRTQGDLLFCYPSTRDNLDQVLAAAVFDYAYDKSRNSSFKGAIPSISRDYFLDRATTEIAWTPLNPLLKTLRVLDERSPQVVRICTALPDPHLRRNVVDQVKFLRNLAATPRHEASVHNVEFVIGVPLSTLAEFQNCADGIYCGIVRPTLSPRYVNLPSILD